MAIVRNKVAVIGAGHVGTTLCYHLAAAQVCDDLVLINRNRDKAWAEVMDLRHSLGYTETKMSIREGTYADCSDADIVVFAVAAAYREGMTRLDMLDNAADILTEIIPQVMASGFDGIFVVITNPVDSLTLLVQKLSGLPDTRVIGTGTSLDSARLRVYLADLMDVDVTSVNAMCLGEHGDSMMIPWSQVSVGAKKFTEIVDDNPSILHGQSFDDIEQDLVQVAYNIVRHKGATYYGIASVASRIIRAILNDENTVMPVSTMPHGEYGIRDLYLGLPAVLTGKGVKELVELHLTEEEQKRLNASAEVLEKAKTRLQARTR